MTEGQDGIYIAWDIFNDYAVSGEIHLKQITVFALDRLLGERKTLITNLPAQGVATLMEQNSRQICHLLYASPVKRGNGVEIIEDILPVYNVSVSIRTDKNISRVYLAPQMEEIPFTYENGRVTAQIKKLECHQMAVFE